MTKKLLVQRGFTLIEILVVSTVSIIILVLLSDLFITALQRTQDGRLRVDMQQRALFALNKWERDLEKTSARVMVVKPGEPMCVALPQADSLDGYGQVFWTEQANEISGEDAPEIVVYAYKKAERILQRETYPPEDPRISGKHLGMRPYLPTFTELDSLTSTVSGQEVTLSEDVEEFALKDGNGNDVSGKPTTQPLLFHLKLRRPLSTSQRFAEFTIDRRYTLRNNF